MPESEPSVIDKKARRARFAIHQGKLVGFADDDKTAGITQRDVLRFAASLTPALCSSVFTSIPAFLQDYFQCLPARLCTLLCRSRIVHQFACKDILVNLFKVGCVQNYKLNNVTALV